VEGTLMAGHESEDRDAPTRQLNSWKEIAAYLGRETRTIQRWEKEEGLPIRRHLHSKRSSVYALQSELDTWWRSRQALLTPVAVARFPGSGSDAKVPGRLVRIWLAAAIALGTVAASWLYSGRHETRQSPVTAVPLTAYPGIELSPTFSPDGDQIAFAWNGQDRANFDIFVKQIESYMAHNLSNRPENEYSPAWSPDGRSIAFLRDLGNGRAGVILIPSRGGPEARLKETSAPPRPQCGTDIPMASLAWSPDGKWLVVSDRGTAAEPFAIFAVSVETGERRRLTSPLAPWLGDFAAVFSPEGSTIAFSRSTVYLVSEIYVLPVSTDLHARGEPRRLTTDDKWSISPAWTPAGDAVVYSRGNLGLFRVGVSGRSAPQRLAFIGESGSTPALSRRGDRLAYARRTSDSDMYSLALTQSGESAARPVRLVSATSSEVFMDYSPDGSRIAFASDRSGTGEIWISERDGSNPAQFTFFGAREAGAGAPRWSPDGKQIIFDSRLGGAGDIWAMSVEGKSPPRRLTTDPASDLVPSWSRSGQWVYFASNRTGEFQVWKMPSAGGMAVQVTRHGGGHALESADGGTLYYSKTLLNNGPEGPSIWRVPVNGGEETKVLDSVSSWSNFRVTDKGIYFTTNPVVIDAFPTIQYYSFADHRIRLISRLDKEVALGLSVSPDGRTLLYSQVERLDSDLMLVEGFH
jgi:Tol biopolymer transport system component